MSLYEAAPFFSGTEGCVTQKVRREVSLQITFMVKNVQWPVQWSLFGVIEIKKNLKLERLEFCLSLWLPIKRQDQNPLGQKTGELKQKKNTRLILPNI